MDNRKNIFVAINFLDTNQKSLFEYPIIYYWDGNNNINESLKDESLIEVISEKITNFNFYNLSIKRIYTYFDDENNLKYQEDSIPIKDIYDIETFNLDSKYLWEVLNFLYKCAYKKDYEEPYKFVEVYNALITKYPNKINVNVISNYIKSKLNETYSDMPNSDINKIIKKFYEEI